MNLGARTLISFFAVTLLQGDRFTASLLPLQQQTVASAVFAKAKSAVVTIVTPEKQGSGVIIEESGRLLTNLHVIRGQTTAKVKLASGDFYDDVAVVDVDERRDLAILQIKGFALPTAELGDSDQIVVGQSVFAIGSPKGLELTLSEGIISAVRDSGEGFKVVQTSAALSPGSSGGGLFDASGRLIAITTFKIVGGEALNFAIPINYARGMLRTQGRTSLAELSANNRSNVATSATEPPVPAIPSLLRSYIGNNGQNIVMFEPRSDRSVDATFALSSGTVYERVNLVWDKSQEAYVGQTTVKTVCGQFDKRTWDAPVRQEIYVVSPGVIRDRWTQPTRVNCSQRKVIESTWQEVLWFAVK